MKTSGMLDRRIRHDGRVEWVRNTISVTAVIALSAVGPVVAQSGNGSPRQDLPPGPSTTNPTPPERIGPPLRPPSGQSTEKSGNGAFSGVIHPPSGVDPAVQAPVPHPQSGATPVIPPAGTPGGNPNVQPR